MAVAAMLAAEVETMATMPLWKRILDAFVLVVNAVAQVGLLVALIAELRRHNADKGSVALFYFVGFFLLHFGLWRRLVSSEALRENLTPFLDVTQAIEAEALQDVYDMDSPGQRRVRQLTGYMQRFFIQLHWQAPLVTLALTIMFEVGGRHVVPHWPRGQGRDLLEHCTLAVHGGLVGYGGRLFLVTCAMQWMSSLCMDCSLHLLADRANMASTWSQLYSTVRQHHRLLTSYNRVQAYFSEDMSLVYRVMLFLGLIGALRIAFGIQDINNMIIMGIVYSYVSTICVAGEMQEVAGDTFHLAVCSCPWEGWPVEDRRSYVIFITRTQKAPQVRFRYFGAMRLDTLSSIFNNLFKYLQVMRASISEKAWIDA